jgi:hypothetical protein
MWQGTVRAGTEVSYLTYWIYTSFNLLGSIHNLIMNEWYFLMTLLCKNYCCKIQSKNWMVYFKTNLAGSSKEGSSQKGLFCQWWWFKWISRLFLWYLHFLTINWHHQYIQAPDSNDTFLLARMTRAESTKNFKSACETWDPHSNDCKQYYLLWCDAMKSGRSLPFQKNIQAPPSMSKSKHTST